MAVFKCEDCGGKVSTEAPVCPHCGHPNQKQKEKAKKSKSRGSSFATGCLVVLVASIAISFAITTCSDKTSSHQSSHASRPVKTVEYTSTLYARGAVNIRSGPSLKSKVVRKTTRGDTLKMEAKRGEWFRLAESDSVNEFWVHQSVVSASHSKAMDDSRRQTSTRSSKKSVARSMSTPAGLMHITSDSYVGATDKKYFEKLSSYAAQRDMEAFRQALTAGLLTGTCTTFKQGEPVYIAGTSVFSGLVRVRRQGETTEYWTNMEAVR